LISVYNWIAKVIKESCFAGHYTDVVTFLTYLILDKKMAIISTQKF
jgi:hypothetical protein